MPSLEAAKEDEMTKELTHEWASGASLTDPVLAAGRGEIVPVRSRRDRVRRNGRLRATGRATTQQDRRPRRRR